MDFEKSIIELEKKIDELKKFTESKEIDFSEEIKKLEDKAEHMKKEVYEKLSPWQRMQVAKNLKRPRTLDYIQKVFDDFIPLHGDRLFRDDPAVVGGLAFFEGTPVMVVGLQKGKETKDHIYRNFGMANPEGYRKALRIIQMAERFNRPVITFVDTPGAFPGIGAEERGQAEAIARNLKELSGARTPIIVIVHGEGGSGGALGIAIGDKIFMLENAVYSVISPEGCAAILWKDSSRSADASVVLKMTAQDLLEQGVIDEIIKEPAGGAHRDHDLMSKNIKDVIRKSLKELMKLNKDELVEFRYKKFRAMGKFLEISAEKQDAIAGS
ncbi:MAG: acetyl-CoA carboxylase carboxyltransferase subunit alpha [Candidatus Firestonebacteria bacterium RIFOXYC2_FULL_39_67]|nr:MAG: acetyl-CoA carboxylase carboxyltransferase subunit alpha [Candidatus Firestonebacteria bacterium RIFOXYD2_FULL_39_29]OGF56171.1 MAG: acetyl-CoA carboxylase carboxyltransferase subunit alpha [Candidatus Firestonebacteria bacterium RIFOXYC2_FULL_39_67]